MTSRPKMTRWYSPIRLINIGIRVAISTVFGEFADRRDAMAGAHDIDPKKFDPRYDYRKDGSAKSDFWLDFVADVGDGWNSTYAIARLLAAPELHVKGDKSPLPLARLLIMGGDEVYPTPSREDYVRKFIEPYDQACKANHWPKNTVPHLYLIPGNHDWYDTLLSFLGLFCRRRSAGEWAAAREGRSVGGRATQQTRSYFALKLPHNWWLWGVDCQIKGYVDQPQIDFFDHVARKWMRRNSRLILCTGMPSWQYVDESNPGKQFRTFSYLERIAGNANRGHRLRLVLSGDTHHYSRYVEGDLNYITAGGGGAFLHPTHNLTDKTFKWLYPPPGIPFRRGKTYTRKFRLAPSLFPTPAQSRILSLRSFAFAFLNVSYAFTLGCICAFVAWILDANARATHNVNSSLADVLNGKPFLESAREYFNLVFASPWSLTFFGLAACGYYYLANFDGWRRYVAGILHALAQTGSVIAATLLLGMYAPKLNAFYPWLYGRWPMILYVGIVGGFLSATILGAYFLLCLTFFRKHQTEAFSALRIQDYKNFLRMRIGRRGQLTVYPIGLQRVPRDDGEQLRNPPLAPHLIEPPIPIS